MCKINVYNYQPEHKRRRHPRGAQLNHQDNFLLTYGFGLVDKTARGGLEVKLRVNPLNKQLRLPMEFPPPHETSPLQGFDLYTVSCHGEDSLHSV